MRILLWRRGFDLELQSRHINTLNLQMDCDGVLSVETSGCCICSKTNQIATDSAGMWFVAVPDNKILWVSVDLCWIWSQGAVLRHLMSVMEQDVWFGAYYTNSLFCTELTTYSWFTVQQRFATLSDKLPVLRLSVASVLWHMTYDLWRSGMHFVCDVCCL